MNMNENPLGSPYNVNGQLKTGLNDNAGGPQFHPPTANENGSISGSELAEFQQQAAGLVEIGGGIGPPPEGEMGSGPMGQEPMGQGPMEDGSPPHGEQMGGMEPVDNGSPELFTNYAPVEFDKVQTGGDGYRLGVDSDMVGGQPVVEGYDSEQAVCSDNQVGGGSPFNFITDPDSGLFMSIFSKGGKKLLKRYVKAYKNMQSGGTALLDGVDVNSPGALYDGVQNAGAENMPDACGLTYDAHGDVWTHTQVGGGGKQCKGVGGCKGDCGDNCKC